MRNEHFLFSSKSFLFSVTMVSALVAGSPQLGFAAVNEKQTVMQVGVVKGTVVDTNGEPIIGANVMVKGSANGTITDIDGNFSLNNAQGTLVISFIGYETQEITLGKEVNLKIVLKEDSELLDEVVVVGYGTQKKETLTGAVTVVSDKILKEKGSLSSPLQAMQGQVPGVTITRNSSAPGDESWDMKLRGAVSANVAAPLIIIDGVAYESTNALRNINPSDIESINFLKDASAAIYGSRAAGGVVLITTKQAREGKTKIEYNASYTHKKVGLQPTLMSLDEWANALLQARYNDGLTDSDQWVQYAKIALENKGGYIDLNTSADPFNGKFGDVMDFVFMDTNWTDVLFGDAGSTQHDLAISGGSEKLLYRLSLGYMFDDSNLKWGNNRNQRYNFRLTNKIKVTDWLNVESVIAYNRQDQVAPSRLDETLTGNYPQPGLPVTTIDGKPYSWGSWLAPVWYAELGGDNKLKVSEVNISEQFTFNITKDLDFVSNLGYNTSSAMRDVKKMAITSYNYAGTKQNINSSASKQSESSYTKSSSRRDFYSLSAYLNYKKRLNDIHDIGVMLGAQYELTEYDYFLVTAKDIQNSLETINGAGTIGLKNGDDGAEKWHEAIMSYYSRLNYNYKSKYLVEGSLRYDGSSKFKTGRWALFYGLSGGWRISEESFMKNATWLDELKLRASYGVVGNQSGIDRYEGEQYYDFKSQSGAYIGADKATILDTNGKIASSGREWERIHNYNIGMDFRMFQGRLSGVFELYMKKNNNMLITVSYPGILGDSAGYANLGKFESKGWETQLNWNDKIGNVAYSIGGTFSFNENELTDIGGVTILQTGVVNKQQGYALNSIFGLEYDGKIQNEAQKQAYLDKYLEGNTIGLTNNIRLGDNMFRDINGDGKLTYEDYKWLGSDDPQISYSFNLGLNWNNFDLSVVFQGAAKRKIFRNGENDENRIWRIPMWSKHSGTPNVSVGNTWSPEHPDAYYPTYTNNSTLNTYNYQASTWSVEDGAYIRLKNVTLGYTVPRTLLQKTKAISDCRVYVSGADLWESTKINDGWDPEASQKVKGTGRFPFVRTITVGLNLTF